MIRMAMDIKEIKTKRWFQHFSGRWSLLSCCYFGEAYTKRIGEYLGTSPKYSITIVREGKSDYYMVTDDMDRFGKELAKKVNKDKNHIEKWCRDLRKRTDEIKKVMDGFKGRPTEGYYNRFVDALHSYAAPHAAVKKVIDYLTEEQLKKYAKMLEEAIRKYPDHWLWFHRRFKHLN